MKRILVVGLIGASLAMLIVGFAIPAFAHGPGGEDTAPVSQDAWDAMYEACIGGDWEAMAEAMETIHDQYFDGMPCFSYGFDGPDEGIQTPTPSWGGNGGYMGSGITGGHMGGGMMGGRGGMMGW